MTAYVKRFVNRLKSGAIFKDDNGLHPRAISANEFQQAKLFWLRNIQADLFPVELAALQLGRPLLSKSPILSMHPFIDNEGLIRVGGRLKHSPLSFQVKHPVLLAAHPVMTMSVSADSGRPGSRALSIIFAAS